MSKFPSIEEFDSGQITATRIEDVDENGLNDSAANDFLSREQAILGNDTAIFQQYVPPPSQGEEVIFGSGKGAFYLFIANC